MTRFFLLSGALLSSGLLSACSSTQDTMRPEQGSATASTNNVGAMNSRQAYDAQFAATALSSSALASALGKLAQQRGSTAAVQDWGKQLVGQHSQTDQQLQRLTRRAHLTAPTAMSAADREQYNDVNDRQPAGFDNEFLRALKEGQERDIQLYTEASSKLSNSELRAYAANALPALYQRLQTTEELFELAEARN